MWHTAAGKAVDVGAERMTEKLACGIVTSTHVSVSWDELCHFMINTADDLIHVHGF